MKNQNNIDKQINKILIIRLSSIGDIVLSTHLIRLLRNHFPSAELDFICFSEYQEILNKNKRLSKLHIILKSYLKSSSDKELNDFFKNNEINNYDIIIDLHKNKYSKKIINLSIKNSSKISTKIYKIKKLRLHKLSLVFFKKPLKNDFQIPDIYLETVREIGIQDDGMGLEIWLPDENEYLTVPKKIAENHVPIIAIAPGAAHYTKRYPKEKFLNVMNMLSKNYGAKLILLGGTNDTELCEYLEKSIDTKIDNYCGKTSLAHTTELINNCDLLITNDTGIMHIAAARQVPIVAIFGSSVKELGFTPFRVSNQIVEHQIWCRPCSHIGRESCPLGHFKCMNEILPSDIVNAVGTILNRNS